MRPAHLQSVSVLISTIIVLVAPGCARDAGPPLPEGSSKPDTVDAGRDVKDGADLDTQLDPEPTDAGDTTSASDVPPDDVDLDAAVDSSDVPVDPPELDAAGCPAGEHDGGAGPCVPVGTCTPGYVLNPRAECVAGPRCADTAVLVYDDLDLDGHGDPASEPTCLPIDVDLPPDRATVADDCDDGDPNAFRNVLLWSDLDDDRWTVSRPTLTCIGAMLPAGARDTRNVPGELSFSPLLVSVELPSQSANRWDEKWDNLRDHNNHNGPRCQLERDPTGAFSSCGALRLADVGLIVPEDGVITGIAVHIARRVDNDIEVRDVAVHLTGGGALSPSNLATDEVWTTSWTDLTYGGPDELWGRAWTPAEVNAPDFGVVLDFGSTFEDTTFNNNGDARVDFVSIEVTLESSGDCDDTNSQIYRTVRGYLDTDRDDYGTSLSSVCTQDGNIPGDFGRFGGDCDDARSDTFPGQARYDDTPRPDGTFDYSCDGVDELEPVLSHLGCDVACNPTGTEALADPAPCGEFNTVTRCSSDVLSCQRVSRDVRTRCR